MGGVTVTITNLGTNEVRKVTTAANGSYSATNLEPVSYKLEAEFAGFKKTVVDARQSGHRHQHHGQHRAANRLDRNPGHGEAEATSVNTESGT